MGQTTSQQQRLIGIADLTSRLSHFGVNVVGHSEPWPHMHSTHFEIGKGDLTMTDVVLTDEFLCVLPSTREYQAAVEGYARVVAGRLRCGPPDLFYCASHQAISVSIRWPIQPSVFQGMAQAWLLLTATNLGNGSVARCCVDVNLHRNLSGTTTFDEIRTSVNRVRNAIDKKALLFYPSLAAHPETYQRVDEAPSKSKPSTPVQTAEEFIAGKAYLLAFETPDVPGEIFATDTWDAEYLGVSRKELSQAAYMLRARGLIQLDTSLTFARPSDKLITAGWPPAVGPDRGPVARQAFELSRLFKKEDLAADLKLALKERQELALVFVDLDRFKEVNDTKGHTQGDICLEVVVKAIGRVLACKGKLYRWGGDEFAIFLPDFSTEEAHATAERIRRAVEDSKAGGDVMVTASIGVCATDRLPNATGGELLEAADKAMYSSKQGGRNRVTCWPTPGNIEAVPVSA